MIDLYVPYMFAQSNMKCFIKFTQYLRLGILCKILLFTQKNTDFENFPCMYNHKFYFPGICSISLLMQFLLELFQLFQIRNLSGFRKLKILGKQLEYNFKQGIEPGIQKMSKNHMFQNGKMP